MSRPAVLETDPAVWRAEALDRIAWFAHQGYPFTADDLRVMLPEPHHPSAWGSLFRTAAQRGLITYLYHQRSSTRSRNGGIVAVWVGSVPKAA